MSQEFAPGDILLFQIESGFGLLRLLHIDWHESDPVWHLMTYEDMFLDEFSADDAAKKPEQLRVGNRHLVLTNRAFFSTQTAKLNNHPVTSEESAMIEEAKRSGVHEPSDRSVRLLLGLR
ncbi:MAG: hypothetical protein R2684_07185 [Pyrinomonadaceae bacterium]